MPHDHRPAKPRQPPTQPRLGHPPALRAARACCARDRISIFPNHTPTAWNRILRCAALREKCSGRAAPPLIGKPDFPRPPSPAALFDNLRTTCPPPAPIPHRIHRHRSLRPLPTISHQRSTWDRSGPHRTQSDPTGPEKDPTGHLWDTERETVAQPQNPGWNVR